jgi:hypothetical protein
VERALGSWLTLLRFAGGASSREESMLLLWPLESGVGDPVLDDACDEDNEDNGEGYLSEGGVGGVGDREKSVSDEQSELGLPPCSQKLSGAAATMGSVLRSIVENMMRKGRTILGAWHVWTLDVPMRKSRWGMVVVVVVVGRSWKERRRW